MHIFVSNIDFLHFLEEVMENIYYEYNHDRDPNFSIHRGHNNNAGKHFHKSIEILYLLSGEMQTTVGDKTFVAEKDDIIFVHNYYVHAFAPKKNYKKYYIILPANYCNDVDKILRNSTLPAHLNDKAFNRSLLPIIHKLFKEYDDLPALVKKGYLDVVIGHLFHHYSSLPIENNGNIEFMVDVLHYIDEHYAENITLDSISGDFGYNKYYFSRLFNSYIGENLNNYINIIRLQHFMQHSKDIENVSISKLALECGFDSLTTFYRYFKKIYGDTPKNYFALLP